MATTPHRVPRLGILIDADNSNADKLPDLLAEIAKYGNASVRRAYGNWTSGQLGKWKAPLLMHSVTPVQQFNYTTGKNATDSAMIIDAMDLLYAGHLDGFCIVSSDSDFTRLAARIREQGLTVYGFGERKTPAPFVAACDKFVYTEVLRPDAPQPAKKRAAAKPAEPEKRDDEPPPRAAASRPLDAPIALIVRAIEEESDESGWAPLGPVGSYLTKIRPDFDPRLYGHRKLSDLLKRHANHFMVEERGKTLFVRAVG